MLQKFIHKILRYAYGTFFQASNAIVDNPNLSWAAKGLLLYMLSKPPQWIVIKSDLVCRSTNGIRSVNTILQELEDSGYVVKIPQRGNSGRYEKSEYHVYEMPVDIE